MSHHVYLRVQSVLEKTEQALRDEDDHESEDDPHWDQVVLGEEARKAFTQQEKEGGASYWPHERPHPPHDIEDDHLTGDQEEDEIRGGKLVLDGVEHAGKSREQAREHHRHDFVTLNMVANSARAGLVLTDRLQHFAKRGLRNTPQDQVRERHHAEDEPVQRGGRKSAGDDPWDREGRLAKVQAVLTACHLRPGEDDNVENL